VQYAPGKKGVIFAEGGDDFGAILYIEKGELAFENIAFGKWTKFPRVPLQPGTLNIEFKLQAAPIKGLWTGGGTGTLYVNGNKAAEGTLPAWSLSQGSLIGAPLDGLDIGLDRRAPISWDLYKKYGVFKYTGRIEQVSVTPEQLPN
jgi:hypothetical protein